MSPSKMSKMSKKLHWGRGKDWGKKSLGKGIRRISFYTGSDRAALKSDLSKLSAAE